MIVAPRRDRNQRSRRQTRPEDVATTDRGSVISSRTLLRLIATKMFIELAAHTHSLSTLTTLNRTDVNATTSIERVNRWPKRSILFIRARGESRDLYILDLGGPPWGEAGGGAPKIVKTPLFPLRIFWCQNWPPSYKIEGDKLILGAPLPLRSMETENFKRRYIRYLKR